MRQTGSSGIGHRRSNVDQSGFISPTPRNRLRRFYFLSRVLTSDREPCETAPQDHSSCRLRTFTVGYLLQYGMADILRPSRQGPKPRPQSTDDHNPSRNENVQVYRGTRGARLEYGQSRKHLRAEYGRCDGHWNTWQ